MIDIFKHGYENSTHMMQESVSEGNFVCVSRALAHVVDKKSRQTKMVWHVWITLYGKDWNEKDIERAERNSVFLDTDAKLAFEVACRKKLDVRHMFSLKLKP